jgi:hypothetical protein
MTYRRRVESFWWLMTFLAMMGFLVLPGCMSMKGPGFLSKIGGWFKSPAEKMERAQKKEDALQGNLFEQSHEAMFAINQALGLPDPVQAQEVAKPFASTGLDAMDAARGPLLPARKDLLSLRVQMAAYPLDSPERTDFSSWFLKWRKGVASNAQAKSEWAVERAELQGKVVASAKKWEGVVFWFWAIVIGYVLIMWVLPVLGKAFPALRPVSWFMQGIIAPGVAAAASGTRRVLKDVVAGVEEVRKKALKDDPEALAKVDDALGNWVTPHDGVQQSVDAIRLENKPRMQTS